MKEVKQKMKIKSKMKRKEFFKLYFDLFDTELSVNAVLLLCYLINIEDVVKQRKDDYFRVSNSFIQEELKWSDHIIRTTLEELREQGYIEIEMPYERSRVSSSKVKCRYVKITNKVVEVCPDTIYTEEELNYFNEEASTVDDDKAKYPW